MNIITASSQVFDCFRKGSSVVDDVKARGWAAAGGSLGVFIYALAQLAKGFGLDLPIDSDTAMHIGVGLCSVAGVFVTFATSPKVGLLPAKPADGLAGDAAAGGQPYAAAPVGGRAADTGQSGQVWRGRDPNDNPGG